MNWLGIAAGAFALGGYLPYLIATWRGTTRPARASWWIFSVCSLAACAASYAAGARETLIVPFIYGVTSVTVALLAIRHGEGGWSRLDRACLLIAGASLLVWWLSGDPLLAVAMLVIADTAGHVPTMRKAWRDPRGEHGWAWVCFLVGDVLNLAQPGEWTLAATLFPLSITVNAVVIVVLCFRPSPAGVRA